MMNSELVTFVLLLMIIMTRAVNIYDHEYDDDYDDDNGEDDEDDDEDGDDKEDNENDRPWGESAIASNPSWLVVLRFSMSLNRQEIMDIIMTLMMIILILNMIM